MPVTSLPPEALPEEELIPALPKHPSPLGRFFRGILWQEVNLHRLLFLLGPWLAFFMVEILNKNNPFTALNPTQVTLNAIWYYSFFWLVSPM